MHHDDDVARKHEDEGNDAQDPDDIQTDENDWAIRLWSVNPNWIFRRHILARAGGMVIIVRC